MVKIKIDPGLYDRAKRAADAAGYSSVEEFIAGYTPELAGTE